jgi:hypothetical protein
MSIYPSFARIVRPNNTNAYSANTVVGGLFRLPSSGRASSGILLYGIQVFYNATAVMSSSFKLFLYNQAPPSNIANGSAFSITSDLAYPQICLTPDGINLSPSLITGGGQVIMIANDLNRIIPTRQADLWGYLVAIAGYTPAAALETIDIISVGLDTQ